MAANGVLIFGYGYIGSAFAALLTARGTPVWDAAKREDLSAHGIRAVDPADPDALNAALTACDGVLITAAPGEGGCPGYLALAPQITDLGRSLRWIGYLSSTGVYGDRDGRWVFEDCELNAASTEGVRRVAAEHKWLALGAATGSAVMTFRLPGIYGPGRSAFDRLRDGTARLVIKPDQVFSRIHQADAATALLASWDRPNPGRSYNVVDDQPAPAHVVTAHAARMLGLSLPPEVDWNDPSVSGPMRRFYLDNKRVSNARLKAELGWQPVYRTYDAGLRAILAEDTARP